MVERYRHPRPFTLRAALGGQCGQVGMPVYQSVPKRGAARFGSAAEPYAASAAVRGPRTSGKIAAILREAVG